MWEGTDSEPLLMFRSVLSFSMGFILTESVTDLEIMSKFMYKDVAQLGTLEFIKTS